MAEMCNCAKKSIEKGYIVRGAIYDEKRKDFIDTDYYMPLIVPHKNGVMLDVKLIIHNCPICGESLLGKVLD